ncbi:MAG TPA: quinolinate synthase NadA [Acidimicrobiales bacterium]|nr:quinolinate synthase NadA [Acidimicrobiales bacterium]
MLKESIRVPESAAEGGSAPDEAAYESWARQVRQLARERDAVILAHNYQLPWIQDVADYLGDSLALSRLAAASDAKVIVFCGVHFMAETAKILAPERTVLIPDPAAGCSLADTISADQVRAWRHEHPDGLVVAYVNTSAAVKAESDVCCTSSNAVEVVASLPEGPDVLFLPDMFLGAHVQRQTGRKLDIWMGECHVHAGISPVELKSKVAGNPGAELLVHPECGCTTTALWMAGNGDLPAERTHVLSTSGMVEMARKIGEGKALVATETGILHQLRRANPRGVFEAVSPAAECRYMKMITPDKLLRTLRDGVFEVTVEPAVAEKARQAVERMIVIGQPGAGE